MDDMWKSVFAVAIGAALGALLRWQLGDRLNAVFPTIPAGTLAANLIGAYVVGLAVAFFGSFPAIPPEWRLLVITGFCGGLTTFSAFSAEIVRLFEEGRPEWALVGIAVHLGGSLAATLAGLYTVRLFARMSS